MTQADAALISTTAMAAVQALAEASQAAQVSRLELDAGPFKVHLRRQPSMVSAVRPGPPAADSAAPTAFVVEESEPGMMPITSELVGLFRMPSGPPALVAAGDVVAYIESMALMNEVRALHDGRIVEVLVEPGQPVEYGQVLMVLVPSQP